MFSKGFIPALFSLVSPLAFVASLAVYAADTVASEVGKTSSGKARLLFRRAPVPPGTVGAVSGAGSIAGLAVILVFATAAVLCSISAPAYFLADDARIFAGCGSFTSVGAIDLALMVFSLVVACVTAFFAESLLNEKAVNRGWISKEIGHLAVGALSGSLVFGIGSLLAAAISLPVPP
ncbi:MAG: hypothetical protein B7X11_04620 [Acidobacteria bacterium 37-65-4]|nr:MAG: hypothetical protein B7X11_04620 [Acidobacteria bacterium 37-65-4]